MEKIFKNTVLLRSFDKPIKVKSINLKNKNKDSEWDARKSSADQELNGSAKRAGNHLRKVGRKFIK